MALGLTRTFPVRRTFSIPAAVVFLPFQLFSFAWDRLFGGLRRQYNLTPCGREQGAKWDHIRVGPRSGACYCLFARVFLWGIFPEGYHLPRAEIY